MDLGFTQGPIERSALLFSGTPQDAMRTSVSANRTSQSANRTWDVWDTSQARIRRRRQIGNGPRPIILTSPARVRTRRVLRQAAPKDRSMKRSTLYVLFSGAFLFSAAAFGIGSQMDSPPSLMSRGDYAAARQAIESEARQAVGACRAAEGAARDVCRAQAKAEERVKQADLRARYLGTVAAVEEAKVARVRAEHDLARAKCGAVGGAERGECLTAARALKVRAIAEARPSST
jgi:hypothetical protein